MSPDRLAAFRGCLLGGAVGDALGAPVEFWTHDRIVERYGADGPSELTGAFGVAGAITDDTQMTLFTAEGLLRAFVRGASRGIVSVPGVVRNAYLRWLRTQTDTFVAPPPPAPDAPESDDGWLIGHADLWAARAPGLTCLDALRATRDDRAAPLQARNTSKGCGGVMRVAPVGLLALDARRAFADGCELAAITHGHATGQVAAGAFAAAVTLLRDGASVPNALDAARDLAAGAPPALADGGRETADALDAARDLAAGGLSDVDAIDALGTVTPERGAGWVAEEALAVAALCARRYPDSMERALRAAVTHTGDSDSTGAICGNLLGTALGEDAIPARWLAAVEMRGLVAQVADDLYACTTDTTDWWFGSDDPNVWHARYPAV